MRAILALELIGVGCGSRYEGFKGGNKSNPWVARLVGFDDELGFERQFIRGQRDWSHASGTGARGVFEYYALKPGIYEVNERVSWKNVRRYFLRIDEDGHKAEIAYDEVVEWLENAISE